MEKKNLAQTFNFYGLGHVSPKMFKWLSQRLQESCIFTSFFSSIAQNLVCPGEHKLMICYFKLSHNNLRSRNYHGLFTNTTSEVHRGDLSTNSHSISKHWRQVLNPDLPNLSCRHIELLPLPMPGHGWKCLHVILPPTSVYIILVHLCNFSLIVIVSI